MHVRPDSLGIECCKCHYPEVVSRRSELRSAPGQGSWWTHTWHGPPGWAQRVMVNGSKEYVCKDCVPTNLDAEDWVVMV